MLPPEVISKSLIEKIVLITFWIQKVTVRYKKIVTPTFLNLYLTQILPNLLRSLKLWYIYILLLASFVSKTHPSSLCQFSFQIEFEIPDLQSSTLMFHSSKDISSLQLFMKPPSGPLPTWCCKDLKGPLIRKNNLLPKSRGFLVSSLANSNRLWRCFFFQKRLPDRLPDSSGGNFLSKFLTHFRDKRNGVPGCVPWLHFRKEKIQLFLFLFFLGELFAFSTFQFQPLFSPSLSLSPLSLSFNQFYSFQVLYLINFFLNLQPKLR